MMHQILHRAAQYLAAGGISLLEHQKDDSHTSMKWDPVLKAMVGCTLNTEKGIRMALDYRHYALTFIDAFSNTISAKILEGTRHDTILSWIVSELKRFGVPGKYDYAFHYDLPYQPMTDHFVFPPPDPEETGRLIKMRTTAQEALQIVLRNEEGASPIRVWPHHFDTGALIEIRKDTHDTSGKSIGLGLSIPDGMVASFYYYTSGYTPQGQLALDYTPGLPYGEWRSGVWNGAVLKINGVGAYEIVRFLNAGIQLIREHMH